MNTYQSAEPKESSNYSGSGRPKASADIKAMARGQLLGKYGTAIGAFLLVELILSFITVLVTAFTNGYSVAGLIIYYIIMFIVSLIAGIFSSGQAFFYLKLVYGHPVRAADVFTGFRQHAEKAVFIQFVLSLSSYVCVLPAVLLLVFYRRMNDSLWLLLASVALVAGGIIVVWISLCFSQAFYLLQDFSQYSGKELLMMSSRLMKGHKGRLFYLEVSFIPLALLSVLSCGIAVLWLYPYVSAANANFYKDLISYKNQFRSDIQNPVR